MSNLSINNVPKTIELNQKPLKTQSRIEPQKDISLKSLLIEDKVNTSNISKQGSAIKQLSLDLDNDVKKVDNKKIDGTVVGHPKATGYYPHNSKMEGGFKDKIGKPLHTLQDFLDGSAPYVSIAIDKKLYKSGTVKYGDSFRIPELEQKYGKKIIFKAVDTGGAFTGKGFSRIDICTDNKKYSLDKGVNSKLTLIKVD